MKNYASLILIAGFLFSCLNSNSNKNRDAQTLVLNLLKEIENTSLNEFSGHYLTYETFQEWINDPESRLSDESRKEWEMWERREFQLAPVRDFTKKVLRNGIYQSRQEINWPKIQLEKSSVTIPEDYPEGNGLSLLQMIVSDGQNNAEVEVQFLKYQNRVYLVEFTNFDT